MIFTTQQPMLIDTRQDWEYRTGHIQGAINFPMEPTWWSRWRKADASERPARTGQGSDASSFTERA